MRATSCDNVRNTVLLDTSPEPRMWPITRHPIPLKYDCCGSWPCENAVAKTLTPRDLGDVAVLGRFAEFGGFSVQK